MTKDEFRQLTDGRLLFLDGATGTNLYLAGMPHGVCTESWVLEHPEAVADLQRQFVEAGSQVVYAPTFGANRQALSRFGLEGQVKEINQRLFAISEEAVGGKAYIAADLSPTGLLPEEAGGTASYEEIADIYREQVRILAEEGADLFVIESMLSSAETIIACDAVLSVTDIPVLCSLLVAADGSAYLDGSIYETFATLQAMGASAAGVNCNDGPAQFDTVIQHLKKIAGMPIIAKPNAGVPTIDDHGEAHYAMTPEVFVEEMKILVADGATVIGGCCGTTPEYIRELVKSL